MTTELRTTYTSVMNELADIRKNILAQAHDLSFGGRIFCEEAYDEDMGIVSIIHTYDGEIELFQIDGRNFHSQYLYGMIDYAEYTDIYSSISDGNGQDYPDSASYLLYRNKCRAELRRKWKASGDYYHTGTEKWFDRW